MKSNDNVEEKCKQNYFSSLKLDSCDCHDLVKENNDEEISNNKHISRFDAVSISNIDAKLHVSEDSCNVHKWRNWRCFRYYGSVYHDCYHVIILILLRLTFEYPCCTWISYIEVTFLILFSFFRSYVCVVFVYKHFW